MGARPGGLVGHQRLPRGRAASVGDVVLVDAEGAQLVLRQVHAPQLPVLRHVPHDVDQLERDAELLRALRLVGPVDRDAGDADRTRDAAAVAGEFVEVGVALLVEVLQTAVDQVVERPVRDRETLARVGERDEHRPPVRLAVDRRPELLEPPALVLRGAGLVRDVVDLARERIDRREGPALRAGQEHDPEGEVARPLARQPLHLRVRLGRIHTSALNASRASRARDGAGRPEKTS